MTDRIPIGLCPKIAIVLLVFSVCSANANKNCKNTVMNIVMKQCGGSGIREKRQTFGNDNGYDYSGQVLNLGVQALVQAVQPLVADALLGRNQGPGGQPGGYYGNGPFMQSLIGPYPNGYYPNGPHPYGRTFATDPRFSAVNGFIPPAAGDDLGMDRDLTNEDIEELYDEVSKRLPRAAKNKEETKKMFLAMAARCCHDPELCLKNEKLIRCV